MNHTYQEISHDEYNSIIKQNNFGIFTYDEFVKIKEILPGSLTYNGSGQLKHIYFYMSDGEPIDIMKTDDEWYFIQVPLSPEMGGVSEETPFGITNFDYVVFKCDQWDGFLDCINYIKNKYL